MVQQTKYNVGRVFKGLDDSVIVMGIIDCSPNAVRVAERYETDSGETKYHEYVKPRSELRRELDEGRVRETDTVTDSDSIRETLSV